MVSDIEVFDQIVENIRLKLQQDSNLSDIKFVKANRITKKPNPLKNTYVTLGLSKVDCKNTSFGNYLGQTNGNDIFGKRADILIRLKIYSPENTNGNQCSETFSKICGNLFFEDGTYKIMKISCKEVYHDNKAGAFTLDCEVLINVFVCKAEEEINISDINVQGGI